MESFLLLGKHLKLIDLLENGLNRVTLLNIVLIAFSVNFIATSFWYFTFTARTIIEYSESFYYLVSALLATSWYSIYWYQRREFTEMFSDLQNVITESKLTDVFIYIDFDISFLPMN